MTRYNIEFGRSDQRPVPATARLWNLARQVLIARIVHVTRSFARHVIHPDLDH